VSAVICPHCDTSLLRKERAGNRCAKCQRSFALDPTTNALQLHDKRIRTLVTKLDEGRRYYTESQLYWAAARQFLQAPTYDTWDSFFAGIALAVPMFVVVPVAVENGVPALLAIGAAPLIVAMAATAPNVWSRWRPVAAPMRRRRFRENVLEPWVGVYGEEPSGLIPVRRDDDWAPAEATLAVLSDDDDVLACLRANHVPQRHNVVLASRSEEVPPGSPVALLDDTSVVGYLFAAHARSMLGDRAFDVSLRPRMLMRATKAVTVRATRPSRRDVDRLRAAAGLTPPELNWLAHGWRSPVASLPPAALIRRVGAAVRYGTRTDPDGRAATAVGFLAWPAA
jgi:hypothetical protein